VLEMLKGVRGVSIYEAGKIEREAVQQKKGARSGVQAQYMEVEQQRAGVTDGAEVGLEDVGGLFGDA
jgi:exportin-5